jgi:hypothetical protein
MSVNRMMPKPALHQPWLAFNRSPPAPLTMNWSPKIQRIAIAATTGFHHQRQQQHSLHQLRPRNGRSARASASPATSARDAQHHEQEGARQHV